MLRLRSAFFTWLAAGSAAAFSVPSASYQNVYCSSLSAGDRCRGTRSSLRVFAQEEEVAVERSQKDEDGNNKPFFFVKDMESIDVEQIAPKAAAAPATSTKAAVEIVDASPNKDESDQGFLGGLLWRGVIVAICALWASNFAAAKLIMAEPGIDSSLYTVTRFGIAASVLLPGAIGAIRKGAIDWETAKGAAVCGSWVAFGYLGQTLGLLTTTASRSCVICSLNCVFVAVVAELTRVNRAKNVGMDADFNLKELIPAAVAVLGVAIVELWGSAGAPTIGDLLSFAQPIGFGFGYLQLEELMRKRPDAALPVTTIKLIVVALASFAMFELSPLLHSGMEGWAPRLPDFGAVLASPTATAGVLYTGLITTSLALWIESIAFKRVPATDVSIILTTEPLFAAAVGAVTLGETFGITDYVGATLIIGACISAVLLEKNESSPMCDPESPEYCVAERTLPISPE